MQDEEDLGHRFLDDGFTSLDEAAPRQCCSRLAFGADLNVVYLAVGISV
jgi:hypothetical protein